MTMHKMMCEYDLKLELRFEKMELCKRECKAYRSKCAMDFERVKGK